MKTINRKILYRGFHPNKNGDTIIALNGAKIKGEWVYGDRVTQGQEVCIHPQSNRFQLSKSDLSKLIIMHPVVSETVSQWVTTDKNGKDVFEGDTVGAISYMDDALVGRVHYDNEAKAYEVYNCTFEQRLPFSTIKYVELDRRE